MNTIMLDYQDVLHLHQASVEICLSILGKKNVIEGGRVRAAIALREQKLTELSVAVQTLLTIITSSDEPVDLRRHCLLTLKAILFKHSKISSVDGSEIISSLVSVFEQISLASPLYWPTIHVLSQVGYERMVPLLMQWVQEHDDDNNYQDAVYDLGFLAKRGVNAAWQALVGLIMDECLSTCVRGQAVESMKCIKDFRVLPYLFKLLKNPNLDPYLAYDIHSTIDTLLDNYIEDAGIKQCLYKMFEMIITVSTPIPWGREDLTIERAECVLDQLPLSHIFEEIGAQMFI